MAEVERSEPPGRCVLGGSLHSTPATAPGLTFSLDSLVGSAHPTGITMKQTVRTFVAAEVSSAVLDDAAKLIDMLRSADADVKWVDPKNQHLTLKFLGDVSLEEVAQVCRATARATAKVEPFELEIRGAGAFPSLARPRTLWIGAGDGEPDMITLHKHVDHALNKLGYRKDARSFHPHLTLGRVRRGGPEINALGQLIDEKADFVAGRITVRQLVIFSSHVGPTGPKYEVLGRAKLGGASK